MSSERNELAWVIAEAQACGSCAAESPCQACLIEADAILDAGYRKPRKITTVEELDAATPGTIIREGFLTFTKWGSGAWGGFSGDSYGSSRIALPVTVLYEPGARA